MDMPSRSTPDIGAQDGLLDQLELTQRQLLHSEKMAAIGQLAAGVAHEINNPIGYVFSNITSLAGYVNDLLRLIRTYEAAGVASPEIANLRSDIDIEFLAEDILSLIAESQDGIDRVKQIVQSLKDFSRSEDGEAFRLADIHRCIDSTINVVNNEIKYKAEVVRNYGDVPEVECLSSQVNQVIMNLLVNAAQAIDTRGTITVRTRVEAEGVRIDISDTGSGIPPEIAHRIFDPFFTTKPVGKGTGLGLSLSYRIVSNHGGWIKAQPTLPHGTTFTVWLPLRQPAAVAQTATAT